jgi:hypothetical protein
VWCLWSVFRKRLSCFFEIPAQYLYNFSLGKVRFFRKEFLLSSLEVINLATNILPTKWQAGTRRSHHSECQLYLTPCVWNIILHTAVPNTLSQNLFSLFRGLGFWWIWGKRSLLRKIERKSLKNCLLCNFQLAVLFPFPTHTHIHTQGGRQSLQKPSFAYSNTSRWLNSWHCLFRYVFLSFTKSVTIKPVVV